jgi:hypothetical protein
LQVDHLKDLGKGTRVAVCLFENLEISSFIYKTEKMTLGFKNRVFKSKVKIDCTR